MSKSLRERLERRLKEDEAALAKLKKKLADAEADVEAARRGDFAEIKNPAIRAEFLAGLDRTVRLLGHDPKKGWGKEIKTFILNWTPPLRTDVPRST